MNEFGLGAVGLGAPGLRGFAGLAGIEGLAVLGGALQDEGRKRKEIAEDQRSENNYLWLRSFWGEGGLVSNRRGRFCCVRF